MEPREPEPRWVCAADLGCAIDVSRRRANLEPMREKQDESANSSMRCSLSNGCPVGWSGVFACTQHAGTITFRDLQHCWRATSAPSLDRLASVLKLPNLAMQNTAHDGACERSDTCVCPAHSRRRSFPSWRPTPGHLNNSRKTTRLFVIPKSCLQRHCTEAGSQK